MRRFPYIPTESPLVSYCGCLHNFYTGGDSPRDFLERCLETIERREDEVQAFTALDIKGAREYADAATVRYREGRVLSRIDGMPVGVKDVIDTADMPTQMGSPLFMGWRPRFDAASVSALKQAGAIIIGKTVTTEFAAVVPGPTRNPFDTDRTPGGSSSGSAAAVGIGMIPAGLGTQVIGSITRPASYCGCYGYKPTVGAVNRGGTLDYMSQSSQGVLAASLDDAWAIAYAVSTRVGGDPGYPGLYGDEDLKSPVRPDRLIRLDTAGWSRAGTDTKKAFEDALDRLQSEGVEIIGHRDNPSVDAYEEAIAECLDISRKINTWEFHWPLATFEDREPGHLSDIMKQRLEAAGDMTLADYRTWLAKRDRARNLHGDLSAVADGFVTLGATGAAPVGLGSTGDPAFNLPASYIGCPALTLPCLSVDAMPLGIQVMGFRDGDERLFSQAQWVEGVLLHRR